MLAEISKSMNELDQLAEEIFDYACARREDNKTKNPRAICCKFENLLDNPKEFYRNIAKWHLDKISKVN
jgi:tRNA U34 2-thiouridine synthase MnmA/TrmU